MDVRGARMRLWQPFGGGGGGTDPPQLEVLRINLYSASRYLLAADSSKLSSQN